jgi:hypothetical protein
MNSELDAKLCADFPEIFIQRNMDMQETCMCWGFECQGGWYQIIHDLCEVIKNHIQNVNSNIDYVNKKENKEIPHVECQATQVKEKFGTLRFYTNYDDDYISGAISMAENASTHTCEVCGKQGKSRVNHGWYYVSCDEHIHKEES